MCERVPDFRGARSRNTINKSCLYEELKASGQKTHVHSDVSVL